MHAIELDRIQVDGGTQPRAAIDPATVDEYADAMALRMRFPALFVYFDERARCFNVYRVGV